MSIKIAIVDDHELLRRGVVDILKQAQDIEIVGEFGKGLQIFYLLNTNPPDIILLDLQLPDIHGEELLTKIKVLIPKIKILILSSNENIYAIRKVLNAGANGYLFKDSSQELLLEAIHYVFENDTPFLPQSLQDTIKRSTSTDTINITARELEVLQLLAKEMTSVEIAEKLEISHRTVDVYRLGLLQKFNVKNIVGLVKKAIMKGFIKD